MRSSTIVRSDDLRAQNRFRLLDSLRRHGPGSLARVCEKTALSAATVSMLSSQMVAEGVLISSRHPIQKVASSRGRPRSQLSFNPRAGLAVTVNIAIDLIQARLIDYSSRVLDSFETRHNTRELSEEHLVSAVMQAINTVCATKDRPSLQHIAIAFQGKTGHANGHLIWSPIIRQRDVPLGPRLQEHYAVSTSVDNDCRLISLALSCDHAVTLGKSFATVLFSYGVGLALYLDGSPFAGIHSSALELGHLRFEHGGAVCRCGQRGCIEAYAADYGIERLARGQSIDDLPSGRVSREAMEQLKTAAQGGEQAAVQAFTIAGAAVGEGLATLFTLLDPMPVALVGNCKETVDLMSVGIKSSIRRTVPGEGESQALLHCYDDKLPLLEKGLTYRSLGFMDHLFATQDCIQASH